MALDLEVWLPKFKARLRKLEKGTIDTPAKLARWGATKAKTIAPHDTGSLIQAIAWKTTKGQKTSNAYVHVRPAQNRKWPGKYGRVSRYAAIQHKMGIGARTQAKSGDPHWAFTIAKEGKKKFREAIQTEFDKFKQ